MRIVKNSVFYFVSAVDWFYFNILSIIVSMSGGFKAYDYFPYKEIIEENLREDSQLYFAFFLILLYLHRMDVFYLDHRYHSMLTLTLFFSIIYVIVSIVQFSSTVFEDDEDDFDNY